MTQHLSPLEVWNRTVHSYESIPDEHFERQRRRHLHCSTIVHVLILPILLLGLFSLALYAFLGANYTEDNKHGEVVVPTLLSLLHSQNRTHIQALQNPLYDRLQNAQIELHEDDDIVQSLELPNIWLDKSQISIGDSLTLSWTVGRNSQNGNILLKDSDIIALFCEESESFLEAATIDQIRTTSIVRGGSSDSWWIPSFPSLRQDACWFQLFISLPSDDTQVERERFLSIDSENFHIHKAVETPTAIHLAFTDDISKMVIQFTTGDVAHTTIPVVRIFSLHDDPHTDEGILFYGSTDTYTAQDMCQAPGNLTQAGHFYPPGMLHTVEINDLEPATDYRYQVGLQQSGTVLVWSDVFQFRSAPHQDSDAPLSYVVYGDQGCPYHGWNGGKRWLEAMMERETNISSVHHFGDIAYARGAAHVWDGWFDMIQPMSTRVPLMVAIGNHEYDHTNGGIGKDPSGVQTSNGYMPSWGNFGEDSGGECGVPMAKRFQMPTSYLSNGVFWYSYDYGNVHTTVISSEHDLSPGSPQYRFLEYDLEHVDRSKTPWLIVETHRPLYEGEGSGKWWYQNLVSSAMRDEIEDLLYEWNVDVVLAGHYHEYQRTCDGLYRGKCKVGGPIHITVGSAGARLDDGFDLVNPWTKQFIKGEFGYGRITIANHTDLHFEFVLHGGIEDKRGGTVLDNIWINRKRN